jgi:hypothetical protein
MALELYQGKESVELSATMFYSLQMKDDFDDVDNGDDADDKNKNNNNMFMCHTG